MPTWACPPGFGQNCDSISWTPYVLCDDTCPTFAASGANDATWTATMKVNGSAVLINTCANADTAGVPLNWTVTPNSFILGAAGNITNANVYDMWQIDNNDVITNIQSGL